MREWVKRKLPSAVLRKRWSDYYWREFNGEGEKELSQLPNLVAEIKTAIDIGGSVGTYTFHLSRLAERVVTFEPNPELHWRYERLKLPNVQLERVALSDTDGGIAELAVPISLDDSGLASIAPQVREKGHDFKSVSVPLRTLDSYNLTDIDFIKIDVEGHEEAVLHGAKTTLYENRPTLLIEIEERHNQGGLKRIVKFLSEFGYKTYFFGDTQLESFDKFDLGRDQSLDISHGPDSSHRYINNFIFLQEPN